MSNSEKDTQSTESAVEQPVVDEEPYSVFSPKKRRWIVTAASLASFLSPLSSSIYFPALNPIADDLHVTVTKVNLTVTTYMIFQAISPTIIAGFSDNAGRRPAYVVCFSITIASNIALALQSNYAALLVLRCVQATGSAGTVALAYSVVSDCVTTADRGKYIGWASVSTILGPSISPILGGILSQYAGWHWIFWFTLILTAVLGIPILLFLPESCRKVVDNGSISAPTLNKPFIDMIRSRKAKPRNADEARNTPKPPKSKLVFPNPFSTLAILRYPLTALILLAGSLPVACMYALLTGMPSLFGSIYHLSTVKIGLVYLPYGAGSLVATVGTGRIMDWNYRRHAKRLGFPLVKNRETDLRDFPLERARLEGGIPLQILGAACIVCYGWVMYEETNLAVPLVILAIAGFCQVSLFQITSVLLVDIHPEQPATASAASNLIRGALGAGASAAVGPMIDSALGVGWTYTVIGLLQVSFFPVFLALTARGPKWRRKRLDREAEKARKASNPSDSDASGPQEREDNTGESAKTVPGEEAPVAQTEGPSDKTDVEKLAKDIPSEGR
ncbi:MAG: hypothetical protein Q9160_005526 [Pyrenula sp. 1 TL-2023]